MSYYYLIASLPMLELESEPTLSLAAFRSLCAEHLTSTELRALDALLDPTVETANAFVRNWQDRETQIRNAVARLRSARRSQDPTPFLRPTIDLSPGIERRCAEAMSRPNPLERERALDRIRWAEVQDAAGVDTFSLNAVLAYAVMLQLVERWTTMNDEAGQQRLEALATQTTGTATALAS